MSRAPLSGLASRHAPLWMGLLLTTAATEEARRRKRGRPPKSAGKVPESPTQSVPAAQTPQLPNQSIHQTSPPQASPTKSTPTKGTVLKALPTVRDHTTDQLNEARDEYIPRELDEAGDRKVTLNGSLLDGRQYRCRTFYVPNRGDKLFMLATECARVLGYRDSYLLFNKNRSLHKIIANQTEKDDLISQEILPYSYRSRQIAIVTARSMFRQFGSRLIVNGRRVRDDYWEGKARKQGFTEEDAAGEKRPGAAKQREAQAAAEASSLLTMPQNDITYAPSAMQEGFPPASAPYSLMSAGPTDDLRPRDYSHVQRPRQDITAPPYVDRTGPSPAHEILNQAGQTAEFNKTIAQQRSGRTKYLEDIWTRPHDSPVSGQRDSIGGDSVQPPGTQGFQSPQMPTASGPQAAQSHGMMGGHHPQHAGQPSQIMAGHAYSGQPLPASSYVSQSPVRQPILHLPGQQHPSQMSAGQHQAPQRSPSMPMPGSHNQPGGSHYPAYGGAQGMWPPHQPQPSPLSQQHHPGGMPQYAGQHLGAQQSPHMGQRQSPMHAQAQQHGQSATPQLHHSGSAGSLHSQMSGHQNPYGAMGAQGMGLPQSMNPYAAPGGQQRAGAMYGPGGTPTPQQFLAQQHGGVSQGTGQAGMQGWAGQGGGGGQWGQGGF